jgi:hypothetical protein
MQYTKLSLPRREIRVLALHHDHDMAAPVECSLRTVSLDDTPDYQALSYCWGDPAVTESIRLEGESIQVTISLAAALRAIRYETEEAVLWADAICI